MSTNNRAFSILEALFPNALPNAIVCYDAYSAWLKLACRKYQLCMAHLLRDLKFFEDYGPCKWVEQINGLFCASTAANGQSET